MLRRIKIFKKHVVIDDLNITTPRRRIGLRRPKEYYDLRKSEMIEYQYFLSFKSSSYNKLTEADIRNNINGNWDWSEIFSRLALSEEFLREYSNKRGFSNCITHIRLSEAFIMEHISKFDIGGVLANQNLSEEMLAYLFSLSKTVRISKQFVSKTFNDNNKSMLYKTNAESEYSKWIV